MSTYEPHHHVRDLAPSRSFGHDPSIPDAENHRLHLLLIAKATNGRGFPFGLERRP